MVRIIQPEELSTPTNDQPSSVDNSTGVGGGSEHQPSSGNGEIHHQEENVVVQPHGPLIPGAPVPRENRVNEDDAGRPMVTLGRWIAETLLLRGVHLLGGWATEGLHRWATDNLGSWAGGPAVVLGRWATEYLAGRATVALRRWLGDRDVGIIQPEELSTPVQCETNQAGLNGAVVYEDRTDPIPSLRSGEIHHQEENVVVQPHGPLIPGAPVPSANRANEDAGGRRLYRGRAAVALMRWVVRPLLRWVDEALVLLVVQALGLWATETLGPWAGEPADALVRLAAETLRGLVTGALEHWAAETANAVRNHDNQGPL